MICIPPIDFPFPLLLSAKSVSLVAETLPDVEVKKPEVEKPFEKQARSFSTTHPVASVSQALSNTYRLSRSSAVLWDKWPSTFNL